MTTLGTTPVEALWPLIQAVGRGTARKYPGVDPDDLVGDLAEFVVKACSPERAHPLDPENEPGCRYIMYRAAGILAAQARAAALAGTSQYDYRPDDVREILPIALDEPETWGDAPVPSDARSLKEASDSLDVVLDVRAGLDLIPFNERAAIIDWYREGPGPRGSSESRAFYRAVESLARAASTFRGQRGGATGVGRRAMSNAKARYIIDHQMEG